MAGSTVETPSGVAILGAMEPRFDEILTPEALAFVADLQRTFNHRREELLAARVEADAKIRGGALPDFLKETQAVRDGDWKIAGVPADLQDRRVEITGPVDRKMVINALNSGAKVFMADFEDAPPPPWSNLINGQINLADANKGSITFHDPSNGKDYALSDKPAVLIVRPRGWHLTEAHMTVDGKRMSGSLFDFGLYFFHNVKTRQQKGVGTYFYLPKLENHVEARLWNDVFVHAQEKLGVPRGTIKATVLIETITASFEMDEILYELKDHIAGLNAGRWDYIFSFIKRFRDRPDFVLPDRAQITMTTHFMRSYSQLLIKTCHRRGAHAMGGMAAQIPIRSDEKANEEALAKVKADKEREAGDGHDGTWVAHPGLVPIAKAAFDDKMPNPNQVARQRQDVHVTADDLLKIPEGQITEAGLRTNLAVGVLYIEPWLRGIGCVPINNLMEDAATAEISRAQVWQWIRHKATFTGTGTVIDAALVRRLLDEEVAKMRAQVGEDAWTTGKHDEAAELFYDMVTADEFGEFLTLPAYERVVTLAS